MLSKKKEYWTILPALMSFVIVSLLLSKQTEFDVISFNNYKNFYYSLFLYAIVALPLLLLSFFGYWRKQSFQKKVLLSGLVLYLAAINFRTLLSFQFTIVFVIAVLVYFLYEKKIYRPQIFQVFLLLYFGITTLSLLWTNNLKDGIMLWRNEISPIAFIPILFCFFKLNKQDFDTVALVYFRFSILFATISICSWVLESRFLNFPLYQSFLMDKYDVETFESYQVVYAWSPATHPTYNGLNLLISLAFGWCYISKKNVENNIRYVEFGFLLVVSLILTIITASRYMAVMWMVVNVLGVIYSLRKNKNTLIASSIVFFTSGVFAICFFFDKVVGFISDPVRNCHYKAAAQSIKENTWFGTGLGGMTKYINIDNPIYNSLNIGKNSDFRSIHPHNQIIGDWMQSGVIGLAIVLFIIGLLLYYGIKHQNWLIFVNTIIFLLLMSIEMPLIFISGTFGFVLIFNFLFSTDPNRKIVFNFDNRVKSEK